MIARRSFSTVSRVLFASNKAASGGGSKKSSSKKESSSSPPQAEAPKVAKDSFKNDSYNAPEYFAHNKWSYADVTVTLAKSRLPQKSNQIPS